LFLPFGPLLCVTSHNCYCRLPFGSRGSFSFRASTHRLMHVIDNLGVPNKTNSP
jgi:hypothetical protein